jgi:hypothetical protein
MMGGRDGKRIWESDVAYVLDVWSTLELGLALVASGLSYLVVVPLL